MTSRGGEAIREYGTMIQLEEDSGEEFWDLDHEEYM